MAVFATKRNGDLRNADDVNVFLKQELQKHNKKPVFLSFDDTWNGQVDTQWFFDVFAGIESQHCRVLFDVEASTFANVMMVYLFCATYFDRAPIHDHWMRHEEAYRRERSWREFQKAAEIAKQAKKSSRKKYH